MVVGSSLDSLNLPNHLGGGCLTALPFYDKLLTQAQTDRENKMSDVINSDTRALARYTLVQAILEADNREIILGALTQLAVEYVGTAVDREIKGKEESHARWAHAANELGTLLICAHYNLEDERGE